MSFNQPFTSLHTGSLTLLIIYLSREPYSCCNEFAITRYLKKMEILSDEFRNLIFFEI